MHKSKWKKLSRNGKYVISQTQKHQSAFIKEKKKPIWGYTKLNLNLCHHKTDVWLNGGFGRKIETRTPHFVHISRGHQILNAIFELDEMMWTSWNVEQIFRKQLLVHHSPTYLNKTSKQNARVVVHVSAPNVLKRFPQDSKHFKDFPTHDKLSLVPLEVRTFKEF